MNTFAAVNVSESNIARLADETILTLAEPVKLSQASTKAFTTFNFLLLILLKLGIEKNNISSEQEMSLVDELIEIPSLMKKTLDNEEIKLGA